MEAANSDTVKGKWTEIKGELQSKWGKLTSDDLERTKGNVTAIAGLIRQHYGEFKEDLSETLHGMFNKNADNAADKVEDVKLKMQDKKV